MTPWSCALLAALLLVPGLTAAGEDVRGYLPIEPGRLWQYESTKVRWTSRGGTGATDELVGEVVERVVGRSEAVSYSAPVYVLLEQVKTRSAARGQVVESAIESHVSVEPDQILIHAQRLGGPDGVGKGLVHFDSPLAILKLPLPEPGEPYPSRLEILGMTIDSRPYARGTETVETPAGRFEDCLRISSRGAVSGLISGQQELRITAGSVEETLWFARGVGLVRQIQQLEITVELPQGGALESRETTTRVLVRHGEGGKI